MTVPYFLWTNPAAPSTDGPLYCGYFFDGETALYQVRNRYYDSSLSTFISRDPSGYEAGIDLYQYAGDSPTTRTDPSGLGWWSDLCWGYSTCTRTPLDTPSPGPKRAMVEFTRSVRGIRFPYWVDWKDHKFGPADISRPCRVEWSLQQLQRVVCRDRDGLVVSDTTEVVDLKALGSTPGKVVRTDFGYGCDAKPPK